MSPPLKLQRFKNLFKNVVMGECPPRPLAQQGAANVPQALLIQTLLSSFKSSIPQHRKGARLSGKHGGLYSTVSPPPSLRNPFEMIIRCVVWSVRDHHPDKFTPKPQRLNC